MKPKTIIVNEEDEVIGEKERQEVKPEDIYRVSSLWITNSKGEALLARRALSKSHDPGIWGPAVAGTVESGETYESNIIKEAEEELGLVGIKPVQGPKKRAKGKHTHFTQQYFLTLDKEAADFKIQKEEVEEVKWFSKEELAARLRDNPEQFLPSIAARIELF